MHISDTLPVACTRDIGHGHDAKAIMIGKEYSFSPDWKINVNATSENPEAAVPAEEIPLTEQLLHFKLGQTIGYFTKDGKIALSESFPAKASISDTYYSLYNSEAQDISFYN